MTADLFHFALQRRDFYLPKQAFPGGLSYVSKKLIGAKGKLAGIKSQSNRAWG